MTVTVSARLAVFEFTGRATRDTIIASLSDVFKVKQWSPVSAAIALYDRADVDLSPWDWMAIYAACKEGGLPASLPTAIVVKPSDQESVLQYCRRQASHGILRSAFVSRNAAKAWASDIAALIDAQRICQAQVTECRVAVATR